MTTYQCSKCNYTANSRGNANSHIENVSKCKGAHVIDNIVKVTCGVCNKEFDTEKLLTNHKKRCIKKAVSSVEYINPKNMEEYMINTTKVVNMVLEENKQLREELKDVKKRLEKLEGIHSEESEEEMDEENLCEHCLPVKFIPTSKEQVKTVLKENGCEDFKNITVTLNGQRNLEIGGLLGKEGIEVDNVMYYFKPDKKEKSTSDIKVIVKKYCSNNVKKGQVYCKEHSKYSN